MDPEPETLVLPDLGPSLAPKVVLPTQSEEAHSEEPSVALPAPTRTSRRSELTLPTAADFGAPGGSRAGSRAGSKLASQAGSQPDSLHGSQAGSRPGSARSARARSRPGSARPESARPEHDPSCQPPAAVRRQRQISRAELPEWTPWTDRITKDGHKDAVLFVHLLGSGTMMFGPPSAGTGGPMPRPPSEGRPGSARPAPKMAAQPGRSSDASQVLVTAAADGSVRLFDLNDRGQQPCVRERMKLQPPDAGGGGPTGMPPKPFCTAFEFCEHSDARTAAQLDELNAIAEVDLEGPAPSSAGAILVGYQTGRIIGWDVPEGRLVANLVGHGGPVTALRCRRGLGISSWRGDLYALSASHDSTVRVWGLEVQQQEHRLGSGGRCLFTLDFGPRNPVADFVLLPRNMMMAACWNGTLSLINLKQPSCEVSTQASAVGLRTLCIADSELHGLGEDQQVFAGTEDGWVSAWHLQAYGRMVEVSSWKAHKGQITAVRTSRSWLLTASEDRSLRIWEAESGLLLQDFRGHAGGLLALSVSHRNRLVWSGSRDWTIRSWDLAEVERRVWEGEQMARCDAQSWAEEVVWRAHVKAMRKKKKPKSGKAKDKPPRGKKR